MNKTSLFLDPVQSLHFLSVFSYINTLSDIFYSQHLIESKEQFQPFPIINAFFEYLDRSTNETEAKRHIVQRLLQGSELYGGNQNETLDMEYIDSTFQYIISNVVFADYGNVYGYLAKIVNLSNNLTLSSIKQEIFQDLAQIKYVNDDGTVSKLSSLAAVKIRDILLWPLFPQPEQDMNITDVNYIYAQAGLISAHSTRLNFTNLTFNDFIMLSLTLELTVLQNETDQSALTIFTLPALLFYAYEEKEKFQRQDIADSVKNEDFLAEAFNTLFSHLNKTFETISEKAYESSPLYQFKMVMSEFKTRTFLSERILRKECPLLTESEYESAIDQYKLYASGSKCPNNESISLPNVDDIFRAQNNEIQEKYRVFMDVLIQEAFYEAQLVDLINSTETTVFESQIVPLPIMCMPFPCPPYKPRLNPNVYLFALRRNNESFYFALVNNENNVTLLSYNNDTKGFLDKLGLPGDTKFEVVNGRFLKRTFEHFETFVDRVARSKAKQFANQLHTTGYEETFKEKALEVLLAVIPFYNCVRFSIAGDTAAATVSCISDVVSWIPFGGQLVSLGYKLSKIAISHVLIATGVSIRTFVARQAIRFSLHLGLQDAASGLRGMVTNVILTKEMFRSLSLGLIRAVDPGFELVGKLHWKGGIMLGKVFKKTWTTAAKKFSFLDLKFTKSSGMWQQLRKKILRTADDSGMIPVVLGQMDGHDVFRYTYPGGTNPFGPKYVRLPNGNAELRRMNGINREIPVVISRVTKRGQVYYTKFDLKTGDTFGLELKLNKNGLLRTVRVPFRKHIKLVVTEGLSGRGRVKVQRDKSIQDAVELLSNSDLGISRQNINRIIKHYVLAIERPVGLQGHLWNVKIDSDLIQKIDDVNPNTIKEYLGEGPLTVDPNLNEYLVVPTYNDFALDWIRTRSVDDSYKRFYLRNSRELESLRSILNIDTITENELAEAQERIATLFGQNYVDQVGMNMANILNYYDFFILKQYVNFVDYFVLLVYFQNHYTDVIQNIFVQKRIRSALYRLAIRQADEDEIGFTKILYAFDLKNTEILEKEILPLQGESMFIPNFGKLVTKEDVVDNLIRTFSVTPTEGSSANKLIPVKYEVHLDSQYLAANLNRVIPVNEEHAIILPNVELIVDKIIRETDIVLVKMYNRPVTKETWLIHIMKELNKLK